MYGPPAAFHFYKHTVVIDEEMCTGCFTCIEVCEKRNVLGARRVDERKKAYVKNPDNCIGCMRCYQRCLVKAISCKRTPKEVRSLE